MSRTPFATVLMCLASTACATGQVVTHDRSKAPVAYAGTQLNLASLTGNEDSLDRYEYYGMKPPEHPVLDLPLSLAADTGLLVLDTASVALSTIFGNAVACFSELLLCSATSSVATSSVVTPLGSF
ncbi:MAG: hypothetical protein JWQ90_4063 [Hydrocarboniphaga sp.]|uniref:YceK/YidQ family lipoprotein n=1 Tax=Hydrocarboniphaga sp. TaxID=2033016 RepID=UPI002614B20E|nr:YceK/YidQ family lipoprotein [Hydrocarboniphaga sp.]MDB5971613.1 hypothetical protein [Hydrocarboniphaga sp.]